MAAQSEVSPTTRRKIERDLAALSAVEGLTEEQRARLRLRAAWLADRFARDRAKAGRLTCDDCGFDPVARAAGTAVKPRTLMDVHHKTPLAEGIRRTTVADFVMLCPICHRLAHEILRLRAAGC